MYISAPYRNPSGCARVFVDPGKAFFKMPRKAHDVPTTVTAEEGEVMLDGPAGLAVSFTPDAASKSAAAIAEAAAIAHRQSIEAKHRK
ncbi:hypothetical protein U1769_06610 [Sphingomonas sp. ZT3P38]|uniref:hypothetical protein n=1 Tax=Parasphingomonas zepuensis TaxID=3096161 RepID=UPI002FC9536F